MKETWKDIKEYEGLYQVSDMGRVRSLNRYVNSKNGSQSLKKGRVLKPRGRGDYVAVILYNNGKLNHTMYIDW